MSRTIAVAGASGALGRRVVARLRDDGWRVRALTRDPARAPRASDHPEVADRAFREAASLTRRMLPALPSNRELLAHIRQHGLPRGG